jgi:cation-transporting ATPase 13A3/4/5
MMASNIDHLVDDIVPWKGEENFVIAITGKAFSHMLKQVDSNPKARRVFGIMLERA